MPPATTGSKARRKAAPKKATSARRRPAQVTDRLRSTAGDATKLSEDVLKAVEDGQRAAIDAVQRFVDTVDRALPPRSAGASRRQEVIDSAMDMSDRLVHTQYEFLRKVVHSAGKSLSESGRAK